MSESKSMSDQVKEFIGEYIAREILNIAKEKNGQKNISYAFRGIGDFGEELATILYPNSYCSASKGGCSFDNFELDLGPNFKITSAREVKTCCHIQPKKCKKCKEKVPYYQEKCSFCKNDKFIYITDSRFSINAKSHFDYIDLLKEYLLIIINDKNGIINISVFMIKSSNSYFNNYVKNQLENSKSSDTCNLVPYSYDFYSSGPIKIIGLDYDSSGNLIKEYVDRFNNTSIDLDRVCLNAEEKIMYGFDGTVQTIPYEDIKDRLVIRKKNLNKPRGKTSRL
jgi:hypothetical protein